ncbi:formate dehydrogenase subunit alpha [Candidatus Poribacteria bacterium]|nr:formate dehydrogenase subunit alpha [Candidatus Poribacteria bacterium]
MGKVSLMIDGRKVTVEEGMTILEAAKSIGIEIPHLCYMEGLPPTGACRLCVVEVEGAKTLVPSCSYPVSEGMVVWTNTERVRKARRLVIELLISDHPLDCMTCEKSGSCLLEKYAYELGVSKSRFDGERHSYPIDDTNPFFERDYSKCVLCGRCVTVCQEVQYQGVIDFIYRGFRTKIGAEFDKPLGETDCVSCGNCVLVCPVGALIEKGRKRMGREWELEKIETTCPYCGCGCSLTIHVKDNRIVKVTSRSEGTVNQGWLCVKGKFAFEFTHHPDRLTKPLIKENGRFREASWNEALSLVAKKLGELKEKYGPDSIAGLSSAKCTNEENYLFQKFMRAVVGTNNVDHCARLCHASTVAGLARAFGSGAMTNSIDEIADAECILVTGSNTTENHPIIALRIKEAVMKNGAKLIVADPRKIELVSFATLWLRQRPGTDVALFNGMMNVIISEELHNEEFIEARTEGFELFRDFIKDYTPEAVERITGVPAERIIEAARIYAKARRSSIIYSMGITQHTTGTDNVLALANLAMLTGNVGRESTGVNPLRGQNNVQGACDLGALPNVFPGYQRVDDPEVRAKFERAWGVDLPSEPGLTVVEMMHAVEEGKIKAMYIMGENPALSDPNLNRTRKALQKLDFLVVQDIFLTETAEYADVVLPAASAFEKDGTFTNTERRIQRVRKAIDPPGEAMEDWRIICELAREMGYEMDYDSPAEIMAEIALLTPIYGGIFYDRLEKGGLQWPCTDRTHPGTKFLHKDKFSRGLGKFHITPFRPADELPDDEYPLLLTTGRVLYHWHTRTMTSRVKGLNEIYPEGVVQISSEDAEELGIKDGQLVRVRSRRGEVTARASVTDVVSKGVVFMTFHFRESAANLLTNDALDPIAKIPELKVCAVKIEPEMRDG